MTLNNFATAGQAHVVPQYKNLKHNVLKCQASFQCEELKEMVCFKVFFYEEGLMMMRYESKHVDT
jgi:hypothetical protein